MKLKNLIGKRIRLRTDVDRYPDFIVWENSTGTIVEARKGQISAKMDEKIDGAKEWDNCLIWQDQYLPHFETDIEILEDEPVVEIERFDLNK